MDVSESFLVHSIPAELCVLADLTYMWALGLNLLFHFCCSFMIQSVIRFWARIWLLVTELIIDFLLSLAPIYTAKDFLANFFLGRYIFVLHERAFKTHLLPWCIKLPTSYSLPLSTCWTLLEIMPPTCKNYDLIIHLATHNLWAGECWPNIFVSCLFTKRLKKNDILPTTLGPVTVGVTCGSTSLLATGQKRGSNNIF